MEKNMVIVEVKKGAWTKEEDILLRNCIEKYGEGKWHLVPLRAGLNRCRKSCRLRWLNYLRPNIKRGYFTKDEVDLIVRLHKLLGNRWSLIAGRIPGRTANDVKNFWNSHFAKKSLTARESCSRKTMQKTISECNIIRPRARTLTMSALQVRDCPDEVQKTNDENLKNETPTSTSLPFKSCLRDDENPKNNQPPTSLPQKEVGECIHDQWWRSLLEITENKEGTPFSFSGDDFCGDESITVVLDGLNSLSEDVDVRELLAS